VEAATGAIGVCASYAGVSDTTGGVVGPSGECLPSSFPAFLELPLLKSLCSKDLTDMASAQIDETDRDCDEVDDGYAKSSAEFLDATEG
jgi:hypothetical protein